MGDIICLNLFSDSERIQLGGKGLEMRSGQ
jgi:hypothetical protein